MEFFPLFLRLLGRPVLLVGGGEVAARKLRLLLRAGADITVVAPSAVDEIMAAAAAGQLRWESRVACADDVHAGQALVVAATDDEAQNAQVAVWANDVHVLVNVVDAPALCTAVTPAIVDRSPLVVAISSGGSAPVYVRRLRARLEQDLPPYLGKLLRWAGSWRVRVREAIPEARMRLRFWEWLFEGPVASQVLAGKTEQADGLVTARLQAPAAEESRGEVWLVGAGPGDPDLLTMRAVRRMQQADVVVHDRLIGPRILELVRRDAERIDVGKRKSRHTLPQEDINALLVRLAREGKRVLRLKGGDPFVFGRGGEEIGELMAAGVAFEVIPGITAASGAAAYAGIPLTHRDHAQACVFVTGHPRADGQLCLPWRSLAAESQTVVVYMGLTLLAQICHELIAAGAPGSRPAALVENATREDQRTVVATLETLPEAVAKAAPEGPGLLIIGGVVGLREALNWRPDRG